MSAGSLHNWFSEMGCEIEVGNSNALTLVAPEKLRPLDRFDGDLMTDAIPPLMAVLAFGVYFLWPLMGMPVVVP